MTFWCGDALNFNEKTKQDKKICKTRDLKNIKKKLNLPISRNALGNNLCDQKLMRIVIWIKKVCSN